jgi:hypothetical protein
MTVPDTVASSDMMISEQWIGKYVGISGRGLIWGTAPALPEELRKPRKICQQNQSRGRDSNQAPPKYKSEALQLDRTWFHALLKVHNFG